MYRKELRLSGFGGQGIILSGIIIGRAVALYDGKHSVQTQSYGAEARGGACVSEVVISDEQIDYPKVIAPDILLAMSQEAFNRYARGVKEGGVILVDEDMVQDIPDELSAQVYRVPATRLAFEELGRRIVANMVMLGALVGITSVVSEQALTKTVLESVPKGTEDLNRRALALGLRSAEEMAGAPLGGGGGEG